MTGSRRARRPPDGDPRPKGTARDAALRLLGVRWRSRHELTQRLRRSGYPDEEILEALDRLEAVGLVDDERFATELVKDQASRRFAGGRAIRTALRQRGIETELAERSLEGAGDEQDRALELARRRAPRLGGLEPHVAFARLSSLLLRRGYPPSLAREVARTAIAEAAPGVEVPELEET